MRKGILSAVIAIAFTAGLWPGVAIGSETASQFAGADLESGEILEVQADFGTLPSDAAISYHAKMSEMVSEYGEPELSTPYTGMTYVMGIGYAALLDMGGDGVGELIMTHDGRQRGYGNGVIEIWDFEDGVLKCVYSGSIVPQFSL